MDLLIFRVAGIKNGNMKSISQYILESREIKNPKFRKLMKQAGLEDISLIQDNGYLWITSDTNKDIFTLPETAIYVNSFNDMTPEEWVEEIKRLLSKNDD